MRITEKVIDQVSVMYSPEVDIISKKPITGFDVTSYQRTVSDTIYDTCLEITTFCNQECSNCFSKSSYRQRGLEMDYSDIEDKIKNRIQNRIRFAFSGGEPFLHSKICNILELPSKYQFANYWLITNGFIKNIDEYINAIIDNEWCVAISIHGMEKTHNMYTKMDSYQLAEKNLLLLAKHTITHIYSVVNEYTTFEDIDHMIKLRNQSNAHLLRFILPRKFGRVNFSINHDIIQKIPCSSNIVIKREPSNTELIEVNGLSRIVA